MNSLPAVGRHAGSAGEIAPADRSSAGGPDEVLQLVIVDRNDDRDGWSKALIDIASRNDGFLEGRVLRSADGARVVVGVRWRDVDAMAAAATASAALQRPAARPSDEPIVVFLGHTPGTRVAHLGTAGPNAPAWTP
ncbi:MAG TPA: hypothetical protein VK860_02060 [Ilumatobacteraceae bacterium]|nr:hypothetical protein [Ilumatobacteraceae bacterium]